MQPTFIRKLLRLSLYALPLIGFAANSAGRRAEVVPPPRTEGRLLPVKVIIYKSQRAQLSSLAMLPAKSSKTPGGRLSGELVKAVKAYVGTEALAYGVNPSIALWIVKHESHFNPRAKGDGEASRGLWQISRIYHPEVSDAMAFSVTSSTQWSLERIRAGKANEWSTYRFCRTLYQDCPF